MLSIGKLAAGPGAGVYYVDQVALGAEDYYAGEGEVPGVWIGTGAASLGLAGTVGERQIVALLEGRDPASGELLGRPLADGAVAGFDLTFRAPKSVSVLFGIAEARAAGELRAAHAAAVADAIGYLEREACWARRGAGGTELVRGGGFVAAAFEHRSSRAGDPLLHTHVVVANVTQGPDGRWTALDGRALYRHAKTAGFLYQATLRAEIGQRFGLEWGPVVNGVAELEAVPRAVVKHFSRRRAEIVELMAARGERSARAAQVATLETRKAKRHVPIGRLREEWRARAAEHGLTAGRVERALRVRSHRRRVDRGAERVARWLQSPSGLTRERSTFTRRDVLQAFAEAAADGAPVAAIEARADALLAGAGIAEVEPVGGERRFTTRALLEIEHAGLNGANREGAYVATARSDAVEAALTARPVLSGEQRALVEALTQGGRGVDVVRAPAGSGKTFAVDAARDAWARSGIPMLGCALSARAACELRDQAGVETVTIARLIRELDRGTALLTGSVLIVDEAGMVGTRQLARLIAAADDADAKLVLIGDDRQLPEIEAGGMFHALANRPGTLELAEGRRQYDAWDREALAELRDGDVGSFAHAYHDHGRLVTAPTAEELRERLVDDWLVAATHGERAVMIANRRRDVADLNRRARARLRARGDTGHDQLFGFAVGDRVIARRNDRLLGVVNGDLGHVTSIADGCLAITRDDGRELVLPERYVCAGHLQHGYAITAHLAQGATVDRAFVLGSDELYREWGYTALSRHRTEARFYVTGGRAFLNRAADPTQHDAPSIVMQMLDQSRAERLATTAAFERAERRRVEIDLGLVALRQRRGRLRWYQRGRRDELDTVAEEWRRERQDLTRELDRLAEGRPHRTLTEPQHERGTDRGIER